MRRILAALVPFFLGLSAGLVALLASSNPLSRLAPSAAAIAPATTPAVAATPPPFATVSVEGMTPLSITKVAGVEAYTWTVRAVAIREFTVKAVWVAGGKVETLAESRLEWPGGVGSPVWAAGKPVVIRVAWVINEGSPFGQKDQRVIGLRVDTDPETVQPLHHSNKIEGTKVRPTAFGPGGGGTVVKTNHLMKGQLLFERQFRPENWTGSASSYHTLNEFTTKMPPEFEGLGVGVEWKE